MTRVTGRPLSTAGWNVSNLQYLQCNEKIRQMRSKNQPLFPQWHCIGTGLYPAQGILRQQLCRVSSEMQPDVTLVASAPVASDAIAQPVDTVAGDAAILQHLLCQLVVNGLQRCQGVALNLHSARKRVRWQRVGDPATFARQRRLGVMQDLPFHAGRGRTWIGPRYFPSPRTAVRSRSKIWTRKPRFSKATARTRPPMPAPAIRTRGNRHIWTSSRLASTESAGAEPLWASAIARSPVASWPETVRPPCWTPLNAPRLRGGRSTLRRRGCWTEPLAGADVQRATRPSHRRAIHGRVMSWIDIYPLRRGIPSTRHIS